MFADHVTDRGDEDDGYCWVGLNEALEWGGDESSEDVGHGCCVGVELCAWREVIFEIAGSEKWMFEIKERPGEDEDVGSLGGRCRYEAMKSRECEVGFRCVRTACYQVAEWSRLTSGICKALVVDFKLRRC